MQRAFFTILLVGSLAAGCTTGFKKAEEAHAVGKSTDGEVDSGSGGAADEEAAAAIELECPGTATQVQARLKKGSLLVYCDQAGTRHGPAVKLHKSGRVHTEGNYESGKQSGKWVGYWDTEKHRRQSESHWKEGKRDGPYQRWHKNGKRAQRGRYAMGKKTSEWAKYRKNGKPVWKGNFVDGKRDGLWAFFDDKGKREAETTFVKGKKQGEGRRYHPDGVTVMSSGMWENGKRVGEWKRFDAEGEPLDSEKCDPSCKD